MMNTIDKLSGPNKRIKNVANNLYCESSTSIKTTLALNGNFSPSTP